MIAMAPGRQKFALLDPEGALMLAGQMRDSAALTVSDLADATGVAA